MLMAKAGINKCSIQPRAPVTGESAKAAIAAIFVPRPTSRCAGAICIIMLRRTIQALYPCADKNGHLLGIAIIA